MTTVQYADSQILLLTSYLIILVRCHKSVLNFANIQRIWYPQPKPNGRSDGRCMQFVRTGKNRPKPRIAIIPECNQVKPIRHTSYQVHIGGLRFNVRVV